MDNKNPRSGPTEGSVIHLVGEFQNPTRKPRPRQRILGTLTPRWSWKAVAS